VKLFDKEITLLVYDFDGVHTDNSAYIDQDGREMVRINRSDGMAVHLFKKHGLKQLILSTEINDVVQRRAEKLGIPCLNGIGDKFSVLSAYLEENKIALNDTAYIGNDLNDIEVMQKVGLAIAPANAVSEVKAVAAFVLQTAGGEGAIRELLDHTEIKKYTE